ncbi:hypothetical protein D3C71_1959580 [compost metagenome]
MGLFVEVGYFALDGQTPAEAANGRGLANAHGANQYDAFDEVLHTSLTLGGGRAGIVGIAVLADPAAELAEQAPCDALALQGGCSCSLWRC